MTEQKTMLDYALEYHDKGFNIIPISTKDKRPIAKFKNKIFSRAEVVKFWTQYPQANIAIVTSGEDIFCIDIDVHDPEKSGFESIEAWEYKDLLTPTLSQRTASGGRHIVYRQRPDVKVKHRIGWLESVDIKGSRNNYFVVPPSKTPKGVYQWENSLEIATPSLELVNAIMTSQQAKAKTHNKKMVGFTTIDVKAKNYSVQMWELFLHGAKAGQRNDSANRILHYWRKIGLEPQDCIALFEGFQERCEPPFSDEELRTVWGSVWR